MSTLIDRKMRSEQLTEDVNGFRASIEDQLVDVVASKNGICTAHNDAKLFKIGDAHPCVAGLVCVDKTTQPDPQDNTKFQVVYRFEAPDPEASAGGDFSMAGSLSADTTTRDRTGAQVVLTYTYPSAPNYKDFTLAGQTRTQIPQLDINKPTLVLRWTRLQNAFATAWANRAALGTVNATPIWGFAAELLLCSRMEIERANQKYREIFEFQYKGTAWKSYAIFLQEDDNRPVTSPDAQAEKNIDVYPTYDFSLLGLLLPA